MLSNSEIIAQIKSGAVGILPTDTLYGIVCAAVDRDAVKRLYALKAREHKPGTIIAASIDQLVELGLTRRYLKAVEQFWPNPISVIIPAGQNLEYLHQGLGSLPVRIPSDVELLALLEKTGALLTSSANHPGEPPASNVALARQYFGDNVDFFVDGGEYRDHQPSTLIRIVDDAIEVLRQGAAKVSESGEIAE